MNKNTVSARRPTTRPSSGRGFPQRMFDELFNQFLSENNGEISEIINAAMDVSETDHAFQVKMDLPGVDLDSVDIQIDNNLLTVRGERKEESEERDEEKQYHRVERYTGSFSRSVALPSTINEAETVAEFQNGVLEITIPKAEDAKPRKISIKS